MNKPNSTGSRSRLSGRPDSTARASRFHGDPAACCRSQARRHPLGGFLGTLGNPASAAVSDGSHSTTIPSGLASRREGGGRRAAHRPCRAPRKTAPRIASPCHVTQTLVGSDDVLVCCRPGRDGSRHFDRDDSLRSIDEQLRSPSSPGLHHPLQLRRC